MKVTGRLMAAMALALAGFVAFAWMWALDVHVDERNVDGVPAFCGSAYDVVRHDPRLDPRLASTECRHAPMITLFEELG